MVLSVAEGTQFSLVVVVAFEETKLLLRMENAQVEVDLLLVQEPHCGFVVAVTAVQPLYFDEVVLVDSKGEAEVSEVADEITVVVELSLLLNTVGLEPWGVVAGVEVFEVAALLEVLC